MSSLRAKSPPSILPTSSGKLSDRYLQHQLPMCHVPSARQSLMALILTLNRSLHPFLPTPPSRPTIIRWWTSSVRIMLSIRIAHGTFLEHLSVSFRIRISPLPFSCHISIGCESSSVLAKTVTDITSFVQFYNTPMCSARAHLNHSYGADGGDPTDISFTAWAQWVAANSSNTGAKIFLGLPASPAGTYDDMYLSPAEALEVAADFFSTPSFGGIMLWEATLSENNTVDGKSYAKNMKDGLFRLAGVTSGCPRTRILGPHFQATGNLLLFIVISCSIAGLLF